MMGNCTETTTVVKSGGTVTWSAFPERLEALLPEYFSGTVQQPSVGRLTPTCHHLKSCLDNISWCRQ